MRVPDRCPEKFRLSPFVRAAMVWISGQVSGNGRAALGGQANRLPHLKRRGSALLAVMWMSAALAAIAFSLSSTVRGEGERASTELDSVRAYFLATGAIERTTLDVLWSINSSAEQKPLPQFTTGVDYSFSTGTVHVEILPEAGKLAVNAATPEELDRLMLALGADPSQAATIAEGIVAWRTPAAGGQPAEQAVSVQGPSFQPAHTSFEEIEELLLVRGVTPDLFYGSLCAGRRLRRATGDASGVDRLPLVIRD